MKANLCRWKVIDNSICEACGLELESSRHVFWGCEKAREIWVLLAIPFEAHVPEFEDLIWYLKFEQRTGNDLLELVVMVSWAIWFNRNEVRQGKARQTSLAILQKARYMREEFQTANLKLSEVRNKDEVQWEAPVAPWYKVNSDAAIFTSNNSTGLRAII